MDEEVEILEPHTASYTIVTSRHSNPRPCNSKPLNPSHGTDLICTCDENDLIAHLRRAVERKDFEFVLRTLRGRELRFRRSKGAMEDEFKTLKEEYEGFKIKHRETESQLEGLEIKHRETESKLEGLEIKYRETESELEGLKKRFDDLAKCNREKISEGLNLGTMKKSVEFEGISVKEIVAGCETPDRGLVDGGVSTPFMEVSTPKCSEKSVEKGKEGCRVKRTLNFGNEDNAETQERKRDGIAGASNVTDHGPCLPLSSVDNVVNRVSSPLCYVELDIVSEGLSPVDGLGNNEIGENRQSDPMGIMKRSEDEIPTSGNLGASCHSSEEKLPKDGLQCSIPVRKIDMEGSVDVGSGLRNDVVILSDSESESRGPSLRKRRLSSCSKKATWTSKKQNIEEEIESGVKIGGVWDDGGTCSDESGGQPLRRGAKRRCQMTVSSGSESSSSDVGFSFKRRKPRKGNLQRQVICEAERINDMGATAGENGQCETVPKGPKEDAVLGVSDETYECQEVEDVPDMKLKRIRKTKDVNDPLTEEHCDEHRDAIQGEVEHCDEHTDEIQGETSPVARLRSLKRVSSIGGRTFANKGNSGGATKVAERLSDSPIYTPNNRTLRSQSKKMINLTKESDGEDEDESDSQIDDLGDFIVDCSESEKDSECADGNKSDSENSTNSLDSKAETDTSSGDDLHEVIRKLSRQNERKLDWKYEGEMLAAFAKDDILCMRAVCALYRQQTNDEKIGKASLHLNRRGFDKFHATRGSLLAEFLTDNDPSGPMKKSLPELQKHDSKGAQYCKDLAIHHSKQLFEIYINNEDPHFPHR